jgi:Uma2 family endonuclease
MALLAAYGLPEYWLLDPGVQTLEVYAQSPGGLLLVRAYEAGETVTSPGLAGLSFGLDRLFTP